jgi:ABC-type Mn2+/Zn2+ transport system ATPase subunit
VIDINNLILFQGKRPLNRPITMTVSPGQLVRLSGGNGTGKTTLFKVILGIHRQWLGSLKCTANGVGYLGQDEPPFLGLTFSEVAPLISGYCEKRLTEVVSSLKLANIASKKMGILSGGELRRTQIALALLAARDLLLLDEPFSGIDAATAKILRRHILALSTAMSVIIVHHGAALATERRVVLEPADNGQ